MLLTFCVIINILLTTFLIQETQQQEQQNDLVQITPITNTGFHYEFKSNLGFVINTWTFLLNVDYNILKGRLEALQYLSDKIINDNTLSNCTLDFSFKEELQHVINRRIANLMDVHDSIRYLLVHKHHAIRKKRRQKRSWFSGTFNFVGRFFKNMIGIMDDRDAELLYNVANRVNGTDHRIKILSEESMLISQQLQSVESNLMNLVGCMFLERQLTYMKNNLDDIESTYNRIVSSIQSALFSKRLSTQILSPKVLLKQMEDIDKLNVLDKETEWVVPPTFDEIHNILQLVQCNVFINPRDEIMFIVQVPRIDKSKYLLYKTISLPDCDEFNVCKFIAPQSPYIGFETRNNHVTTSKHYVRLDDTSTCSQVLDNMTLCFGSITSKQIEYSKHCDVRLFKKLEVNNCEVHATRFADEIFYNLNNVNKWLYMVLTKNPVHAELNCGSGKYDQRVTLHGMGIITLMGYCKLRTSRSILISKRVPHYEDEELFTVIHFNFSNFQIPKNYKFAKQQLKDLNFGTINEVTKSLERLWSDEQNDTTIVVLDTGDNSLANWYEPGLSWFGHLFGNWWWELKMLFYIIIIGIIIFVIVSIKRLIF